MTEEIARCAWCGTEFLRTNPRKVICSRKCHMQKHRRSKGSKPRATFNTTGEDYAHGTWQRYRRGKCRCSPCTSAEHAYVNRLKAQAEEKAPPDPRICEHCPDQPKFPTRKAKGDHVATAHAFTKTSVSQVAVLTFDLPQLDFRITR